MLPDQLVESEGVAELLVLVEDLLDGQLVVGQDLQGRLVVTVVILLRLEAGVEGLEIPSWVLGFLPEIDNLFTASRRINTTLEILQFLVTPR